MAAMESNQCEVMRKSLCGERAVDEKTYAALAILSNRLQRVQQLGEAYAGITFSPMVGKLISQKNPAVAC